MIEDDDLIESIKCPQEVIYPKKDIAVSEHDEEIEYAKENIKELIQNGFGALEVLTQLAQQSENPKYFEILSGMLKNLTDMNKSIVDIEEKRKIDPKEEKANMTMNNKNVFIGTTSDILKMLKESDES